MKARKIKPFKIDPKARQRFTFGGASKTFPVATKDAEMINHFVKEFTKSLALAPKTGTLVVESPKSARKATVKSGENAFRILGRPAVSAMNVYFPKRRKKAARKRDRITSRSSRIA